MKVEEYLRQYRERFKEGFPMYQLGRGRTSEEIIAIIKDCLKQDKDVYAMGLVTDDEDIDY